MFAPINPQNGALSLARQTNASLPSYAQRQRDRRSVLHEGRFERLSIPCRFSSAKNSGGSRLLEVVYLHEPRLYLATQQNSATQYSEPNGTHKRGSRMVCFRAFPLRETVTFSKAWPDRGPKAASCLQQTERRRASFRRRSACTSFSGQPNSDAPNRARLLHDVCSQMRGISAMRLRGTRPQPTTEVRCRANIRASRAWQTAFDHRAGSPPAPIRGFSGKVIRKR